MKITRKKIVEPQAGVTLGRIDTARVDATQEADITRQAVADERDVCRMRLLDKAPELALQILR